MFKYLNAINPRNMNDLTATIIALVLTPPLVVFGLVFTFVLVYFGYQSI